MLHHLSFDELLDAYNRAMELNLEEHFIAILESEICSRILKDEQKNYSRTRNRQK